MKDHQGMSWKSFLKWHKSYELQNLWDKPTLTDLLIGGYLRTVFNSKYLIIVTLPWRLWRHVKQSIQRLCLAGDGECRGNTLSPTLYLFTLRITFSNVEEQVCPEVLMMLLQQLGADINNSRGGNEK